MDHGRLADIALRPTEPSAIGLLAGAIPSLRRLTAYSQPSAEDWQAGHFDQHGRLDLSVIAVVLSQRPLAYLCGSPDFNASMTEELVRHGVPRFDFFAEAFAAAAEVPKDLQPRRIALAGTQQSFEWTPAAGSILDAALAKGLQLPSGCRVGQCESCVVRVAEGRFASQFDAAKALGIGRVTTIFLIVAPQMLRNIAAPMGNYFISLLKATPYLAVIAVPEMFGSALDVASDTFRYAEPMLAAGLIFLVLSVSIAQLVKVLEQRLLAKDKI